MSAVVLDIEGTTSSLASVRDQLFPYARPRLAEWLQRRRDLADAVRTYLGEPRLELSTVISTVEGWSDADVKAPPLKVLQGVIWERGFAAGELIGHVYPDVPPALAAWYRSGVRLCIYSSGSAQAQRTWFRHTTFGDLSGYFTDNFDTSNPGPKRDVASYRAIAASIDLLPAEITFYSDAVVELDAAAAAGLVAVGVRRPEDGSPDVGTHPAVSDFSAIVAARAEV